MEDLLSGAANGLNISPHWRKRAAKNWIFSFKEGTKTAALANSQIQVPYATLGRDGDEKDIQKMHAELASMYNSWPWPVKDLKHPTKQQWVSVAATKVFACPLQIDNVYHGDSVLFMTRVHYIDAKTGEHVRSGVSATATDDMMAKVTVPTLPAMNILNTGTKAITAVTPESPLQHLPAPTFATKKLSAKQQSSRWAQQRAEEAVYWIAAQLQGLVVTAERFKQLMVMYRTEIGLQKGAATKEGLYGDESDLYSVSHCRGDLTTLVAPTKKVADDMGLTVRELTLYIHSLNASRSTPVMETIVQLFCGGDDTRYAWLEAAKTADCVNLEISEGIAPSSKCDCDDAHTGTVMHVCEGCGKATLCKTRAWDSLQRLVCARCKQRDQTNHFGGRKPEQSLAGYLAHRSLWRSFRRECAVRQLNPQKQKAIFDKAWKCVEAQLPGSGQVSQLPKNEQTLYNDKYTQNSHDIGEERPLIGSNPSRRRYIPYGITVDAIHRQGHPDHASLKHSAENLIVTSNGCQMAKGSFNAGALHEVGHFLSSEDRTSDEARKGLIATTSAMAEMNLKRPYINAGSGSFEAKYQKILAESIAGRATPGEHGPWEEKAKRYVRASVTPYTEGGESVWSDKTYNKLQECAISMEKEFGVKLFRLEDGTRWMGTAYSNPSDLDRNGVATLCEERLERMRLECNKKWATVDNAEKLYCEIIFQYCCSVTPLPKHKHLKKKYGDSLGLPLVLWWNNPLRLSIAHRVHGFGMATGWVSECPANVGERLQNDDANNLLCETWINNASKMDMAEEYYDELKAILRSVKVDKSIYNPASVPVSADGSVVLAADIPTQDDFAGAMFNEASATQVDAAEAVEDDEDAAGVSLSAGELTAGPQLQADGGAALEGPGFEESEPQAGSGTNVGGEGEEVDLQATAREAWRIVMDNATLREVAHNDVDLRRLLAKIQQIADDDEATQDDMNECMSTLYQEYVSQAQAGGPQQKGCERCSDLGLGCSFLENNSQQGVHCEECKVMQLDCIVLCEDCDAHGERRLGCTDCKMHLV